MKRALNANLEQYTERKLNKFNGISFLIFYWQTIQFSYLFLINYGSVVKLSSSHEDILFCLLFQMLWKTKARKM